MAANQLNDQENNTDVNVSGIKNICSKYKKYITTGAMLILLAVVVAVSSRVTGGKDQKEPEVTQGSTGTDDQDGEEKLEENAYPQINKLFQDYYSYYADGDTESIGKIAFPISDTEKSYIKCVSKLVDAYEDIDCYTKKGLAEGEYIVSVVVQIRYKDVQTTIPNLDTFYVRTDDKGNSYIDNAYSSSNESLVENKTNLEVNTLLTEFSQDEDILKLVKDVQKEYDEALEKDEELKKMATVTMQEVLAEWVASFTPQTTADQEDDKKDNPKDTDSREDDEKDTDSKGDDAKDSNKDQNDNNNDTSSDQKDPDETDSSAEEQTRTAYAKTKVNMRKKASTSSDILQTLNAGTKVTIYGTSKDGWFKVKCKGKTGYISKEYIVSDPSKVEVEKRVAYAKTGVNLRKKPSTDSDVVKTLDAGTKVMIYGKSKDGWFRIRSKGKFGYVKKEFIVSSKSKVESSSQNDTPSRTTYLNEGDRITLTESVNIRSSMSETADRVGLAYQGDVITVIMSYAEGWTKVSWNGQTGFAKTEFLK